MTDRRDFIKGTLRMTLLGGLAAGCIHLSKQQKTTEIQLNKCKGNGICRKCPLLRKCGAPSAVSYKEAVE